MSAIKILDKKVVKTIDNILESNYKVFEEEKERKQERQKAIEQSEEVILRKMPISQRMKYLNMMSDPKVKKKYEAHWATKEELIKYRDQEVKLPMYTKVEGKQVQIDASDILEKIKPERVPVIDISYDKNKNVSVTQKEKML